MAQYVKIRKLGSGGFGTVWEARRDEDSRLVALKVLDDKSDDAIGRFKREVRILSRLKHPRIVEVLGVRLKNEPYWYVMPLYSHTLEDKLPEIILNEHRIYTVFRAILDGMQYAHNQGVIHRDLKPGNVLMNNDTELAISDFGLGRAFDATTSRKTKTGDRLGTFFYMPPEQNRDFKNTDERSDIYNLGRMLYEFYTEELSSPIQDLNRLPAGIAVIVEKCTKYNSDERFQSVTDLLDAFEGIFDDTKSKSATTDLEKLVSTLIAEIDLSKDVIQNLNTLICRTEEDVDVIRDLCIKIPSEAFGRLYEDFPTTARKIIDIFVENIVSQGWPFDYVDRIATACKRLFSATDDPGIRAKLIATLLETGVGHNRYYAMELFTGLMNNEIRPADDIFMEEELKKVGRLRHLADTIKLSKLPRRLARLVEDLQRDD